MKTTFTNFKKNNIYLFFLTLFMMISYTSFSQDSLMVFPDWMSSEGSQNFFYRNVTKTDAVSNVYIVGATINGSGNTDILVAKYNSSGVLQWSNQYDGTGNGEDMGTGLYIDGSGNVYITGTTQTSSTDADIITIKYNSSGTQQWLSTYDGTGNSYDSGSEIVVDNGDVYITGSSYNSTPNTDVIAIKYNSSGTQQWATAYNYTSNLNDAGVKISVNSSWVVVSCIVQTGTTSWKWGTINFNKTTGAYTTGRISASSSTGIDQVNDMVEDASGNIYIVGATPVFGQGYNYDIIKLTSTLSLAWENTYNSSNLDDIAKGIRVDASGNVYVTGYTTSSTEGKNITTIKYNSSGTQQWIETYNDTLDEDDEAYAMEIDASGNIYVTGYETTAMDQADYFTIKYDASGNEIWKIHNDGQKHLNDKSTNIAIDTNGDIVISGSSETAPGEYEYLTVKYVEKNIIIPADYDDESPNSSFSYYKNFGQLINTDGDSIPDIIYYAKNSSPEFYFKDNSYSMVFAKVDTVISTEDTLHRIDVAFSKSNPNAKTYSLEETKSYSNYYLAQCPEGITEVYGNQRLVTTDIYSNIDVMYSSNQNGIKMYFIVKPGGDPTEIMMEYDGESSFNLDGTSNELTINSSIGDITFERPSIYQLDEDNVVVDTFTVWTPAWYTDSTDNYYKFYVGSYNTDAPLIIQVDLGHSQLPQANNDNYWSTYLGGNKNDAGIDIKTDKNNRLYIIGCTESTNFPVNFGPTYPPTYTNMFAGRFDSLATSDWLTYYGGSGHDYGTSLSIFENSSEKYIYACGYTASNDFPIYPVSNPNDSSYYDNTFFDNQNGFIIKFYENGTRKKAVFFGGCSKDGILSSDVDSTGALVITGFVYSSPYCTDFPLKDPGNNSYYQDTIKYSSTGLFSFIAKLDNLFRLEWSTYFGGNQSDRTNGIATNKLNGDIFITGETFSTGIVENTPCTALANFGFPLCNCTGSYLDSTNNFDDAFIVQFNSSGNLLWSTFVGSDNGLDVGTGVAVNSNNDVYVTGYTYSTLGDTITCSVPQYNAFPMCSPFQDTPGNDTNLYVADIFITKFNSNHQLTWSTFYGGSTSEYGSYSAVIKNNPNITIDNYDNLYITGNSIDLNITNDDFPVQNNTDIVVNQSHNAGTLYGYNTGATSDAYIIWFDSQNQLIWASLYGGNDISYDIPGNDKAMAIAVSSSRMLYITGLTDSYFFPLAEPINPNNEIPYYQNTVGGYYDAFITRIDLTNAQIGIKENNFFKEKGFQVYPNPAFNIINIKFSEGINNIKEIKLFNSFGQVFQIENFSKKDSYNFTMDVSNLVSGLYLMSITTNNHQSVCKFVKY